MKKEIEHVMDNLGFKSIPRKIDGKEHEIVVSAEEDFQIGSVSEQDEEWKAFAMFPHPEVRKGLISHHESRENALTWLIGTFMSLSQVVSAIDLPEPGDNTVGESGQLVSIPAVLH